MKNIKKLFLALALMAVTSSGMAQPGIFVNTYYLTFGEVPLGTTVNTYFSINNIGDEPLEVTDMFFSNDDFTIETNSLIVAPFTFESVQVSFTPTVLGAYDETLSVVSNDPANPLNVSEVTAEVILSTPDYLVGHIMDNDVELSWGANGPEGEWAAYDIGGYNASFGINQSGIWRIAVRWPAEALTGFVGNAINRVAFFPTGQQTTHTLKVWKGDDAETLLYSSPLSNLDYGFWNEAILDAPVLIEAGEMYWVGLEFEQLTGWDAAGAIDMGPGVAGFGDMVNLGGDWFSAGSAGFVYNWLIRTFFGDGSRAMPNQGNPETGLPIRQLTLEMGEVEVGHTSMAANRSLEVLGYNIYRNGELITPEAIGGAFFTDTDLDAGVYTYGVTALYDEGESLAIEKQILFGGPAISFDPEVVQLTLAGGDVITIDIEISNPGASTLEWELTDAPSWASFSQSTGSIAAGGSQTIELTITAVGLPMGYTTAITQFSINNPIAPEASLLIIINVEGDLPAVFDVPQLDFAMVPVLESKLKSVSLTNMTNAILMFQSFTTGTGDYIAYPATWAIHPGESMSVVMSFTPPAAGAFPDTLFVQYFNYQGSGTLKLPLLGEGILMPPSNLTALLDENLVSLNWFLPGAALDVLRFGSGNPFSSIGTGPGTYEFAARFTPIDLMPYAGKQLDKVGFFIHSTNADFRLKVHFGPDADTEIINLPLTNLQAGEWNDISLPFPIQLDAVDYLWIGYEITQTQTEFIAGIDGGPGVTGSGDLIRVNGNMWMNLAHYGYSYNWNIRGLVSEAQPDSLTANGSRNGLTLLGYNVYRDDNQLTADPITELSFEDLIEPGQSYSYGVTAVYNVGESAPAIVDVTAPGTLSMPEGWEFAPTALAHNIHVPVDVLQIGMSLQPGDMLGVFYLDNGVEKAAGASLWTGQHLVLTAYGNDPATPHKDGFDLNETIRWKVYLHQTATTADLVPAYSALMPHHDGTFSSLGLSMLETLEMDVVGLSERNLSRVQAFPNPSRGQLALNGLNTGDLLELYDNQGRLLWRSVAQSAMMNLYLDKAGIYLLKISGQNSSEQLRLVIN